MKDNLIIYQPTKYQIPTIFILLLIAVNNKIKTSIIHFSINLAQNIYFPAYFDIKSWLYAFMDVILTSWGHLNAIGVDGGRRRRRRAINFSLTPCTSTQRLTFTFRSQIFYSRLHPDAPAYLMLFVVNRTRSQQPNHSRRIQGS